MKTGKRITASLLGQKTKRLFKNIIFSLIWLSVFFALLEFISISVIRGYYIKNSEHVAQYEYFIKTGKGFSQRNIASWTSHPFIPYVTEPNVYDKNGLMFNPYGYRSKTVPHENSIRVVCLGGSTTFGWSVKTEESWCYILERDLRRYFKRDDIDVINFGMPAAPSEISLALLHYRALALNPDLVIVLQGINDITHWAKDGKRRSDFSDFELRADWPEKKLLNPMLIFASRSKLFRLFLYIKSGSSSQIIPHFQGWYEGLRRVPDDENESGYETVSWEEIYTRNIKSMIGICRINDIEFCLLENMQRPGPGDVCAKINTINKKIAEETGVSYISLTNLSEDYFVDTFHLKPEGHVYKAREIANFLFENKSEIFTR